MMIGIGSLFDPAYAEILKIHSVQSETLYGEIKGRIVDYETREPLRGAEVSIKGNVGNVRSGQDGNYAFSDVPIGYYILTFQLEGYYTNTRTDVIVRSNRTTFLDMEMIRVRTIDEQVEVTAEGF